ncbi:hypothetical protein E2C01_088921 [Portunus trituberculatus]|uniref:Uncharacterized protein n=1 Tax=Portunus trituberculatus TaxID=210409 RepID=A0A5B7JAL9_PORTR|nr:hypothetical protein [Portunus trituberculatus]
MTQHSVTMYPCCRRRAQHPAVRRAAHDLTPISTCLR